MGKLFFLHFSLHKFEGSAFVSYSDIGLPIADSVESLMGDTHELGGSTLVVDRATPKVVNVEFDNMTWEQRWFPAFLVESICVLRLASSCKIGHILYEL